MLIEQKYLYLCRENDTLKRLLKVAIVSLRDLVIDRSACSPNDDWWKQDFPDLNRWYEENQ